MLALRTPSQVPHFNRIKAVRIVRDGDASVLALEPGETFVLGRSDRAEVVFAESRVSRLHGMLWWQDDAWCYRDLGSANGSFVFDCADLEGIEEQDDLPVEVLAEGAPRRLQVGDGVLLGTRRARIEMLAELPSKLPCAIATRVHVMGEMNDHATALLETSDANSRPTFIALRGSVEGTPDPD